MTPNDSMRLTRSVTDGEDKLILLPSSLIDNRLFSINSSSIFLSMESVFIFKDNLQYFIKK
jgi:hypothetical protein